MRLGHFNNGRQITGNRTIELFNTDYMEEEDRVCFFETYDFEYFDIMAKMDAYGIDFSYTHYTEYYEQADIYEVYDIVESNALCFIFRDRTLVRVYKKINILDELNAEFNLNL